MSTLLTMVIQLYFSNLVYVVYICTCTWVHIHTYICRFVHTCMVWCTLGCPSTYNTCVHVKTPPPHPTPHSLHLPLTSPHYLSASTLPTPPTHSPHATFQPPHSIPSAPHNLIPSPSAQTLINTSTTKSDINPPQSQEHTAVSQHGYPYAVLMSDSLSLTSSI